MVWWSSLVHFLGLDVGILGNFPSDNRCVMWEIVLSFGFTRWTSSAAEVCWKFQTHLELSCVGSKSNSVLDEEGLEAIGKFLVWTRHQVILYWVKTLHEYWGPTLRNQWCWSEIRLSGRWTTGMPKTRISTRPIAEILEINKGRLKIWIHLCELGVNYRPRW